MIAGLVLVALVVTARFTRHGSSRAGYLLIVVSLAWLAVNKKMEGPTLLTIVPDHGLTAGDLVGLVGLVLGAYQARADVVRRLSRLRGPSANARRE